MTFKMKFILNSANFDFLLPIMYQKVEKKSNFFNDAYTIHKLLNVYVKQWTRETQFLLRKMNKSNDWQYFLHSGNNDT